MTYQQKVSIRSLAESIAAEANRKEADLGFIESLNNKVAIFIKEAKEDDKLARKTDKP